MMFVPFQQPHMVPIKPVAKRTKSACINCKAAKVGCSSERPCLWCLRHDLQDTCVDAPKKARNTRRRRPNEDSPPGGDSPDSPSSLSNSTSSPSATPDKSQAPPAKRVATGSRKHPSSNEYSNDGDDTDSLNSSSGSSRFSSPSLSSKHLGNSQSVPPYPQGYPYSNTHQQSSYNTGMASASGSSAQSPSTPSSLSLPAPSMSNTSMIPLNTYPSSPYGYPQSNSQLQMQQQHMHQQHLQQQQYQQMQQQHMQQQQLQQQQLQQLTPHHRQSNSSLPLSQDNLSYMNAMKSAPTSSSSSYPVHHPAPGMNNSMTSPSSSPHSTNSTPIDIPDEEDLNGLIADRVDCNNMLIQSLLASQLTLSQLNNPTSGSGNANGNGSASGSANGNGSTPAGPGGVHPLPPNRKNVVMYNNLIFEELAKLQQSLETISSLVQVQNFSHPDNLPTATLKVSDPMVIVVQDCNNAFAKLLGYEDCYEYLCSPYTKLESIIMPQFASFVNRRVLKMRNCTEPKLLRPTMLLTRQGELKSCFALLKNGANGVVFFSIVKQGVIITSRCRRIMNSTPPTQWEKK